MNKHYIIPIFVPHFGCPHDCIFCNQKKITGLSTNVTTEIVEETIQEYLGYFRKDAFIEAAFYGGSFTAIDIDTQSALLEVVYKYKKEGIIDEIRLSTRPDAIDDKILSNLKRYEVDTIELGVQSLDEIELLKSERGHTADDVYNSCKLIRKYKFKLGLQMMLGLPEDDIYKSLYTCMEFIRLKPDCVRIYPTLVIKETYLEKLYIEGKYKPLDLNEAVEITTPILMLFYLNNINVIRIGLQPTESIQLGKDVVAGPFHPAFRQLVEANIYRELFDFYFSKLDFSNEDELVIEASHKVISLLSGQKSCNTKYWIAKYNFKKIRLFGRENLSSEQILITMGKLSDIININVLMEKYMMKSPLMKNIEGFQL